MATNFAQFLLSSSATSEVYLKICVTCYSRKMAGDFAKVTCANGHAKTVSEVKKIIINFKKSVLLRSCHW